jgi:hypothetical protein
MHELIAVVGSAASIQHLKQVWPSARVRELAHGFSIVPVNSHLAFEIVGGEFELPDLEAEDQNSIGVGLEPLLRPLRHVSSGPFALICTQYFGGIGNQMGVLIEGRHCVGPFLGPGAINRVLELLGILPDPCRQVDSFSVAGLERWRSTEDLIEESG